MFRRLRRNPKRVREYGLSFEVQSLGNVSWSRIESYENGRDAQEHLRRIERGGMPGQYRIVRIQRWEDDRVIVAKLGVPYLSEPVEGKP